MIQNLVEIRNKRNKAKREPVSKGEPSATELGVMIKVELHGIGELQTK